MDLPGRNPVICLDHPGPVTLPQDAQSKLQNFMKGEPVILGVSQIMLGLMNICLWIILKVSLSSDHHLPLNLWGIELFNLFFLGQVFYIMSGTLSVVSGKKMTKRMICGSLGMNIVSSVLAGASLVILALSLEESRWISETGILCFIYGILILKLTITVLELFAALSLSASGCQTVCCSVTSVVVDLSSQELELSFPDLYHEYDEVTFLPS
ncbi:membrane-spanning 4-domains subfamily A member 4A-like isoform X3 [Marmota marmota marmota]|uniref:membrane-spanning 4-domains subfamily A member 4A-like isoform X3 n=1 Tax=Marmota marmota marmota TaxID=9994 RepID=UPI002093B7A2|nr:membrane-spanning 4-domains subfamily A member 4A-like isoform X3 [Marmota marmota marmota]